MSKRLLVLMHRHMHTFPFTGFNSSDYFQATVHQLCISVHTNVKEITKKGLGIQYAYHKRKTEIIPKFYCHNFLREIAILTIPLHNPEGIICLYVKINLKTLLYSVLEG